MMRAVSGFATDACASTAGDAGYGCSDNIAQKSKINTSITNTLQTQSNKHLWIHKLWPKPAKMEPLGPVLGIRIIQMKLWGTPWDPKSVKVGLWAPF